jgi:hypothetical protein
MFKNVVDIVIDKIVLGFATKAQSFFEIDF